MTTPSLTFTSSIPEKTGAKRPKWWAFAQRCISRLRDIETDMADLEQRARNGDAQAFENLLDNERSDTTIPSPRPGAAGAPSPTQHMLNTTRAPHLSPDDWHDIIEAGGDPFATDLEGNSQPPINLPLPDLLIVTEN